MKEHLAHVEMIRQVAASLGPLRERVVFLGGAATGFHITDTAASQIRPTKDVDMIIEVASRVEWHRLEKALRKLGFIQKPHKDDPICRWYIEDVTVDVMPTDEKILGFSNRWYIPAIKNSEWTKLSSEIEIRLVTAPYLLVTKIESFYGRGQGDYLASHDMEDIINLINGRPEILENIEHSDPDLKKYVATSFQEFIKEEAFKDAIPGHLLPDRPSQARLPLIISRMEKIIQLAES